MGTDCLSPWNENIEVCSVLISSNSLSLSIIGLYKSPNSSVEHFMEALERMIIDPLLNTNKVVIAGDMNLNLLNVKNYSVTKYSDFFRSYNFFTINK